MNILTDDRLLRLSAAGEEQAFNALYDRHQGSVYRFVLHSTGGDELLAEEITQEVFLLLIRRPQKYDESRGSLPAYLLGTARNLLRQYWKRRRVNVALPDDDGDAVESSVVSDEDVLGDLTSEETLAALHQAILALPLRYREVVILCHFEGMEYAEAASVLGCPAGTVCSRLHRARALLFEKLKGHGTCLSATRTKVS